MRHTLPGRFFSRSSSSDSSKLMQRDMLFPVRAKGGFTVPTNPWPRNAATEERDTVGLQKIKPIYKRQGPSNRWDQYGESLSAASEAHIASEQVSMESSWGPWQPTESASKDARPAQPYRLQKANKSDGQWSKWASDVRQSQPDQWSSSFFQMAFVCQRRALMETSITGMGWIKVVYAN